MDSFSQGFLAHAFVWFLLAAGAVILGVLRIKKPAWASSILYALAGLALLVAIVGGYQGIFALNAIGTRPQITPENVEQNLRSWFDTFRYGVKKNDNPDSYFALDVTLPDGQTFTISRPKNRDRYLKLAAVMPIVEPMKTQLMKLSREQMVELTHEMTLDIAASNLQTPFQVEMVFPNEINVDIEIPITPDLSEDELIKASAVIDNEVILARESLAVYSFHFGIPLA